MKSHVYLFLIIIVFLVLSCKDDNYCVRSDNCPAGQICLDHVCTMLSENNDIKNEIATKDGILNQDIIKFDESLDSFEYVTDNMISTDYLKESDKNESINEIEDTADSTEKDTIDAFVEETVYTGPTWESGIKSIFKKRCVSCHYDMGTYQGVLFYIEVKKNMKYYIKIGHYINGYDQKKVLEWLDNGYPEK